MHQVLPCILAVLADPPATASNLVLHPDSGAWYLIWLQAPEQAPSPSSSEEEEEPAAAMPVQRPQLASAFNLALNPEFGALDLEFGAGTSESDDDSDEDSD